MSKVEVETRRSSEGLSLSHVTLDVKSGTSQSEECAHAQAAKTSSEMDPAQIVVTRAVVENIVKAHDPTLTVVDFSVESGSGLGDGYMAIMYAVEVNVTKPGSDKVDTHNIMLKTMPLNAARQQMANESKVFLKEAKMYGTVFRDLDAFQKEKGLAEDEVYTDYPFCYATFVDGKADYLAMENLKASGFVMADRTQGLDRAHATLAMKSLAKFHAASYVKFRGNFQAIMDEYPELEDTFFGAEGDDGITMVKSFVSSSIKNIIVALRSAGYESEAAIVEGPDFALETVLQKMRKYSSLPCKHAIIGHSDAWTNNMLFKYDQAGQPIGIKLIDFQLSHPCSRTLDLAYFLNGCLREDLVNITEREFLKIYYDEFASFAKRLGFLDPELTYEQLLAEFDEYRYFGIMMPILAIPFFYVNKADVKNMEDLSTSDFSEAAAEEFLEGMANDTAARRIKNILNVQLPKLKM